MPEPDHITLADLQADSAEAEADMLLSLWHALDLESMMHGGIYLTLSGIRRECMEYLTTRPFVPSEKFTFYLTKVESYFGNGLLEGHVAPHQRRLFRNTGHLCRLTCLAGTAPAVRRRLETTLQLYRAAIGHVPAHP